MKKFFIVFCLVIVITFLVLGCSDPHNSSHNNKEEDIESQPPTDYNPMTGLEVPEGTLFNRAFAVMIENHAAARPLSGLQEADIVYEIPVEGQINRFMAVFTHPVEGRIGPVRSARHYYLPFALNLDAIIAHWGQSIYVDPARARLGTTHLPASEETYYRDSSRNAPHNLYTTTDQLIEAAKTKNLLAGHILSMRQFNINPNFSPAGITANKVILPFSDYSPVEYTYDNVNNVYLRSNGRWDDMQPFIDDNTGVQITVKNIIIRYTQNWLIDESSRKDIQLTGSGEGVYITEGKAVPITWNRESESGSDVYRFADGTQLEVLPGNTWIHLLPPTREILLYE